jgi:hypothetical protein
LTGHSVCTRQIATAAILFTGANSFNGFPALANCRRGRFLPRQLTSAVNASVVLNSIIVLTALSIVLLIVTGSKVVPSFRSMPSGCSPGSRWPVMA